MAIGARSARSAGAAGPGTGYGSTGACCCSTSFPNVPFTHRREHESRCVSPPPLAASPCGKCVVNRARAPPCPSFAPVLLTGCALPGAPYCLDKLLRPTPGCQLCCLLLQGGTPRRTYLYPPVLNWETQQAEYRAGDPAPCAARAGICRARAGRGVDGDATAVENQVLCELYLSTRSSGRSLYVVLVRKPPTRPKTRPAGTPVKEPAASAGLPATLPATGYGRRRTRGAKPSSGPAEHRRGRAGRGLCCCSRPARSR